MHVNHQNFYPESFTSMFEFGRSPDLFVILRLPSITSGLAVASPSIEVLNSIQTELTVAGTVLDLTIKLVAPDSLLINI